MAENYFIWRNYHLLNYYRGKMEKISVDRGNCRMKTKLEK